MKQTCNPNHTQAIMKKISLFIVHCTLFIVLLTACKDDYELSPGNPVMTAKTQFTGAHFGDDLPFTLSVSDHVPLSTLTAKLYFGDEEVSKTVIRTKENGDYSGTIAVPFYKNIPDGTATIEFTLMDTHLTSVSQTFDLPVSRASYPYLILVTAEASYPMLPTGAPNEYAATEAFPSSDLPAYIKTPVVDANGNEITFGWENAGIMQGITTSIPFVSPQPGIFSITFNTRTYEASPFFEILIDGHPMAPLDKENFQVDLDLTQNGLLTVEGIADIADWWIDPDYFDKASDDALTFLPIAGRYRIIANMTLKYFRVEALSGNAPASLQPDGTGAIWVIGTNVGKPSVDANEVGWNEGKALCMAPIGDRKYRLTVVGGETVRTDAINFKFFHQRGWGGEYGHTTLSTTSDLISIGDGVTGDSGNLALIEGVTLEEGATYEFVIDVSAGIDNAVLTVTQK